MTTNSNMYNLAYQRLAQSSNNSCCRKNTKTTKRNTVRENKIVGIENENARVIHQETEPCDISVTCGVELIMNTSDQSKISHKNQIEVAHEHNQTQNKCFDDDVNKYLRIINFTPDNDENKDMNQESAVEFESSLISNAQLEMFQNSKATKKLLNNLEAKFEKSNSQEKTRFDNKTFLNILISSASSDDSTCNKKSDNSEIIISSGSTEISEGFSEKKESQSQTLLESSKNLRAPQFKSSETSSKDGLAEKSNTGQILLSSGTTEIKMDSVGKTHSSSPNVESNALTKVLQEFDDSKYSESLNAKLTTSLKDEQDFDDNKSSDSCSGIEQKSNASQIILSSGTTEIVDLEDRKHDKSSKHDNNVKVSQETNQVESAIHDSDTKMESRNISVTCMFECKESDAKQKGNTDYEYEITSKNIGEMDGSSFITHEPAYDSLLAKMEKRQQQENILQYESCSSFLILCGTTELVDEKNNDDTLQQASFSFQSNDTIDSELQNIVTDYDSIEKSTTLKASPLGTKQANEGCKSKSKTRRSRSDSHLSVVTSNDGIQLRKINTYNSLASIINNKHISHVSRTHSDAAEIVRSSNSDLIIHSGTYVSSMESQSLLNQTKDACDNNGNPENQLKGNLFMSFTHPTYIDSKLSNSNSATNSTNVFPTCMEMETHLENNTKGVDASSFLESNEKALDQLLDRKIQKAKHNVSPFDQHELNRNEFVEKKIREAEEYNYPTVITVQKATHAYDVTQDEQNITDEQIKCFLINYSLEKNGSTNSGTNHCNSTDDGHESNDQNNDITKVSKNEASADEEDNEQENGMFDNRVPSTIFEMDRQSHTFYLAVKRSYVPDNSIVAVIGSSVELGDWCLLNTESMEEIPPPSTTAGKSHRFYHLSVTFLESSTREIEFRYLILKLHNGHEKQDSPLFTIKYWEGGWPRKLDRYKDNTLMLFGHYDAVHDAKMLENEDYKNLNIANSIPLFSGWLSNSDEIKVNVFLAMNNIKWKNNSSSSIQSSEVWLTSFLSKQNAMQNENVVLDANMCEISVLGTSRCSSASNFVHSTNANNGSICISFNELLLNQKQHLYIVFCFGDTKTSGIVVVPDIYDVIQNNKTERMNLELPLVTRNKKEDQDLCQHLADVQLELFKVLPWSSTQKSNALDHCGPRYVPFAAKPLRIKLPTVKSSKQSFIADINKIGKENQGLGFIWLNIVPSFAPSPQMFVDMNSASTFFSPRNEQKAPSNNNKVLLKSLLTSVAITTGLLLNLQRLDYGANISVNDYIDNLLDLLLETVLNRWVMICSHQKEICIALSSKQMRLPVGYHFTEDDNVIKNLEQALTFCTTHNILVLTVSESKLKRQPKFLEKAHKKGILVFTYKSENIATNISDFKTYYYKERIDGLYLRSA